MGKWQNKKTIRGIIIGVIVVVTMGVVIANTKITPAKSTEDKNLVVQKQEKEKQTEGEKTEKASDNKSDQTDTKKQGEKSSASDQDVTGDSGADNSASGNQGTQAASGTSVGQQSGSLSTQEPVKKPEASSENEPAPQPVKQITCSITIVCDAISGNGKLTAAGHPELEAYAANPTILGTTFYTVQEGTTAFDILQQACNANGIALDAVYSQAYGTSYVKAINYLYEFSAGVGSGWMYQVNGVSPNIGASSYKLSEGDVVTWYYVTR
ncbi:MAG: DUF4430 domain-containing protein [Lachnospiraceae bacterium]|nr:DUF4430 domain-containing protein [Lachnospiraceae bacterium]